MIASILTHYRAWTVSPPDADAPRARRAAVPKGDWPERIELACRTIADAPGRPAMMIELTGRIDRRSGPAVPLLLLVKRLVAEYGLDHEASQSGNILTVRLKAVETPFVREGARK